MINLYDNSSQNKIAQEQFAITKNALLEWLEKYGYCVYGSFPEIDALLDKFKADIENANLEGNEIEIPDERLRILE